MNKPKSIHFVGIKGVGVAPLAIIAKEAGMEISGSDIAEEFITDEILKNAGITPLVDFSKDHVGNADLVVTTGAHGGFDNPEVREAKIRKIPVLTQGQAIGEFMNGALLGRTDLEGISVTGSHGKTTTTAIIATILKASGLDPSFAIGTALIPFLNSSGHYGKGIYFVAEADEYATEPVYDKTPKFLWQKPRYAVFTNIELDHPDLYPTIDSIRNAFLQFTKNIPSNGALIAYGDDLQIQKLLKEYGGTLITYGYSAQNDFQLKKVRIMEGKTFFSVNHKDTDLGEFVIGVVGEHNALNAVSAIALSLEIGLSLPQIKKGLLEFKGSKRRFEFVGKLFSGGLVYDDYAHHPTEIKRTLAACKAAFPGKKIVCIFQPHTYSRTKALFNEFVHAFSDADSVIFLDIYASLREGKDETVSSKLLSEEVSKIHKNALHMPTIFDITSHLLSQNLADTVILTMGAGDVYKIGTQIIEKRVV